MTAPVMFVFPGQGSQYRGMGSDLYAEFAAARRVYDEASDVLGFDLRRLSFADPDDAIGLTRNTQPALLAHGIACLEVFRELTGGQVTPLVAGGHSLGEYTALVAAGALTLADGLRLVRRRGELMGEHGEGGMVALTLDVVTARVLADRHYCEVSSINLPDQTVVGGREADLEALCADLAANYPRKRAIRLATEGAFHTYFMVAAARLFRDDLAAARFAPAVELHRRAPRPRARRDPHAALLPAVQAGQLGRLPQRRRQGRRHHLRGVRRRPRQRRGARREAPQPRVHHPQDREGRRHRGQPRRGDQRRDAAGRPAGV